MSSVAGLLVPNNFNIASSGGDIAEGLYSSNNTNVVNVTASPNPVASQVLTATGTNAATWQFIPPADVTASNIVTLTNKELTSYTNSVTCSALFSDTGNNVISIDTAPTPSAGQVLTAISSNQAEWRTLASTAGVFQDVNVETIGSTILSLDLTGVNGTIGVKVNVCVNVGAIGTTYDVYATFTRINVSQVQLVGASSTINRGGDLGGESPEWQHDSGNVIKLVKTGAADTIWGGRWSYISSTS